tara:strand:+ start:1026 stop:1223 length:198 start_codon:yes stop_codon:yes gene_type:complete
MKIEDVLVAIKNWNSEANNFRNDGWVQQHYKNNISKVESLLESFNKDDESISDIKQEEYKVLDDF